MIEENSKQRRNTIIRIVVLSLVVIALVVLLYYQTKNLREKGAPSPTPSPTQTVTATKTATTTVSQTSTATADNQTAQVRVSAEGFLAAYVKRDLEQGKTYMTDAFYKTWTQVDFAGVSSPGRADYQIVDIKPTAEGFEVKAQVNLQLNGEDAGHESWQIDILSENGKYLVDDMKAISL